MSATATVSLGSVREQASAKKTAAGSKDVSQSEMPQTSMQEDIAKLAYALWQQRGCPYGSPEVDWLEAERKLGESSKHVSG